MGFRRRLLNVVNDALVGSKGRDLLINEDALDFANVRSIVLSYAVT